MWFTSKGHDSTLLELKAIAKCGDPMPMAKAMKSLGVGAPHIKDYAMEGTKLFGSTNRNSTCHLVPKATHIDPAK